MFRRALVLAALALTLAATTARADEVLRTISVTGLGEVTATPDIAHATVGVRTVARTARAALSENSTTMAAVLDALRGTGIADRDIRTTNVSLHPRWRTEVMKNGTRVQVLSGYEAANLLRVTCRDLSKLGELLDALTGAGANDMRGISFDVDDKGNPTPLPDTQGRHLSLPSDDPHSAPQTAISALDYPRRCPRRHQGHRSGYRIDEVEYHPFRAIRCTGFSPRLNRQSVSRPHCLSSVKFVSSR